MNKDESTHQISRPHTRTQNSSSSLSHGQSKITLRSIDSPVTMTASGGPIVDRDAQERAIRRVSDDLRDGEGAKAFSDGTMNERCVR